MTMNEEVRSGHGVVEDTILALARKNSGKRQVSVHRCQASESLSKIKTHGTQLLMIIPYFTTTERDHTMKRGSIPCKT